MSSPPPGPLSDPLVSLASYSSAEPSPAHSPGITATVTDLLGSVDSMSVCQCMHQVNHCLHMAMGCSVQAAACPGCLNNDSACVSQALQTQQFQAPVREPHMRMPSLARLFIFFFQGHAGLEHALEAPGISRETYQWFSLIVSRHVPMTECMMLTMI